MKYENKIVCFIDILGFGQMVDKEYEQDPGKIYSIMRGIDALKRDWDSAPINKNSKLQLTQFSDSLVLSVFPIGHYSMNFDFFKRLSIEMVKMDVVLRGGITFGQIHHDSEFVFGPAFNRAYHLESKKAVYPRIVLDEAAMNVKNSDGKTITDYPSQFLVRNDKDGFHFIDFVIDCLGYDIDQSYYDQLKLLIERGLANDCLSIREKYEWMKEQYQTAAALNSSITPI